MRLVMMTKAMEWRTGVMVVMLICTAFATWKLFELNGEMRYWKARWSTDHELHDVTCRHEVDRARTWALNYKENECGQRIDDMIERDGQMIDDAFDASDIETRRCEQDCAMFLDGCELRRRWMETHQHGIEVHYGGHGQVRP